MMVVTNVIKYIISTGFFDYPKTFKEISRRVYSEVGEMQYSTLYPVVLHVCAQGLLSRKKNKNNYWEYVKVNQEKKE